MTFKSTDASRFVENLASVAANTGVTLILTHHLRKPDRRNKVKPDDLLFEIKGASEFVEASNTVLLMEKGKQERQEFGKFGSNSSIKNLYLVKVKDAPTDTHPIELKFDSEKMLFMPITDFFDE